MIWLIVISIVAGHPVARERILEFPNLQSCLDAAVEIGNYHRAVCVPADNTKPPHRVY